ncbi:MAG: hypothetical protein RMJ51_00615 [Candidatus Calescibacterium sp.]|nr:hypothetical protein [Candidatus Calescibacterium sp.]MDW8194736.1 hypothetical protein [Candidatus Calescibacterium sp.]
MDWSYIWYKVYIPYVENPLLGYSLFFLLFISGVFWYYLYLVRTGRLKSIYIRKIPALNSIEEAVGRSTEMGKPILYVPGIQDIDNIQTLASLSILSYVAQKCAEYETDFIMPVSRSVVMTVAQEVVKESYLRAGRSDLYRSDMVFYLTDDQFGYAAGVDGIISREKPGAIFLIGAFYAESLILAETGFSAGAIQIAGTAMITQLPFFIAACDYVLIGEELFAASAYLSKDILDKITLRTQDVSKALVMASIALGSIVNTTYLVYPNIANIPLLDIVYKIFRGMLVK